MLEDSGKSRSDRLSAADRLLELLQEWCSSSQRPKQATLYGLGDRLSLSQLTRLDQFAMGREVHTVQARLTRWLAPSPPTRGYLPLIETVSLNAEGDGQFP